VLLCGTSVGGASVVYASVLLGDKAKNKTNTVLLFVNLLFVIVYQVAGVVCENPVAHPERFISEHIEKATKHNQNSFVIINLSGGSVFML
jgi:hypothetical protein